MATTTTLTVDRGGRTEQVEGEEITPGLYVVHLPDTFEPARPFRWTILHRDGKSIADAMTREDATAGAQAVSTWTDWTQTADEVRSSITGLSLMYATLTRHRCEHPRLTPEPWQADAYTRGGTYTDADVAKAAAEYEEDGFSAFEITVDMAHRMPWSRLDTEQFNEAHARICSLVGAA